VSQFDETTEKMMAKKCICGDGRTIEFRGKGSSLQSRVCPMVGTEGHLTWEQCDERFKEERSMHFPKSGRFG